ncbi:MAG: glutaredoxin family protein [Candidatus Harrisonbacteria bacterium]|nr:glutaredoxin family protein [Candidatus Harrisonbacteria bacterium]MBI2406122.1 glutaredoxin family protein [Candidatus Harrisonbacteria bacterium]MBI2604087.1 glutaredoxin family protein [Candidatus Harrisonbacteria bacterium]MBI3114733.1 glutaredoxin family protein [Candidatus Harrisonbacteria bacterium]
MAKSVKIYSTPTCMYCKMAKDFLAKHGVQYDEVDVAENMDARKEMVEKSHQLGVPVIDIDGELFVGFNRSELERALGLK